MSNMCCIKWLPPEDDLKDAGPGLLPEKLKCVEAAGRSPSPRDGATPGGPDK